MYVTSLGGVTYSHQSAKSQQCQESRGNRRCRGNWRAQASVTAQLVGTRVPGHLSCLAG